MANEYNRVIEEFIGFFILVVVYGVLLGPLFNFLTCVTDNANLGLFGPIISVLVPILIGAGLLTFIIYRVRKLFHIGKM